MFKIFILFYYINCLELTLLSIGIGIARLSRHLKILSIRFMKCLTFGRKESTINVCICNTGYIKYVINFNLIVHGKIMNLLHVIDCTVPEMPPEL